MEIIILISFILFLCILNNNIIENFGNQLLLPDFTKSIFVGKAIRDTKIDIKYDETKKPSAVEDVIHPPYSEVDFNNLIGTEDNTMVNREIYSKLENINDELENLEKLNFENKYLNKSICGNRYMQIVNPPDNTSWLTDEERSFIRSIKMPESCLWARGIQTTDGSGTPDDKNNRQGCNVNNFPICYDNIMGTEKSIDEIKQECMDKNSAIWGNCRRFCCQNLLFPTDLDDSVMTEDQKTRYELFTNNITEFKSFTLQELFN